jgi:hypothetical protein
MRFTSYPLGTICEGIYYIYNANCPQANNEPKYNIQTHTVHTSKLKLTS